jgi:hypothetical protein
MWKSGNCVQEMRFKKSVWNEIYYLQQRNKSIWKTDHLENSAIPLNLLNLKSVIYKAKMENLTQTSVKISSIGCLEFK